jgi:long-chain acyl-CoA synthetase
MARLTVTSLVNTSFRKNSNRVFAIERKRYRRRVWTYQELNIHAERAAAFLIDSGVTAQQTVGICAPNSPLWLIIYIACVRLGIIVVPLDVNATEEFICKVADKTDIKLLFKTVYKPLSSDSFQSIDVEHLDELLRDKTPYSHSRVTLPDDILEIVFTSGSTGDPKGVVLTHANVASNVVALKKAWKLSARHQFLSMIPLSHMFEQTVGFLAPFVSGSRVVYIDSIRPFQIVQALQTEDVNSIVTVPAFLSLLHRRVIEKATQMHYKRILEAQLSIVRHLPRVARRYCFSGLYQQLGQSLKLIGVGGAALPAAIESFWETIGIQVMQGYGLTETSPIATYNGPKAHRRGSVGRCLPTQSLSFADDGEILLAGKNVFSSYLDSPEETAKVLHGGWFHTGDIGRLDKDGFLYITVRKKNMLLSESGLNIYPEDIEVQLAVYPAIKDSVVAFTYVENVAVLTAVVLSDETQKSLPRIIQMVNAKLPPHEAIQRTLLWPEPDFPRTPTRKIKRQEVISALEELSKPTTVADKNKARVVNQLQLLVANMAHVSPETIRPSTNLVSDLGLDSLMRLELLSKIEEDIGAFVSESSITGATTFSELEKMTHEAEHSPKSQLFKFTTFESRWFSVIRIVLQLPLLWFAGLYQKLDGERLTASAEPVIYIANHTSHFDGLTMLRILPLKSRGVLIAAARDYFFKNRFASILLRFVMPIIPIDRDGNIQESLRRIGTSLDDGFSVVLFPEGTRATDGEIHAFKQGIGVIAQELEVPIVPLKFIGNDYIMPKGKRWPKRGVTEIRVGKPMLFGKDQKYSDTTATLEKAVREL